MSARESVRPKKPTEPYELADVQSLIQEEALHILASFERRLMEMRRGYEAQVKEVKEAAQSELGELSRRLDVAERRTVELEGEFKRVAARADQKDKQAAGATGTSKEVVTTQPATSTEVLRESLARVRASLDSLDKTKPSNAARARQAQAIASGLSSIPAARAGSSMRKPTGVSLVSWLESHGIKTIDRRDRKGGSLWIVGPKVKVSPLVESLQAQGITFKPAPNGSRATGGQPGWYTKQRD